MSKFRDDYREAVDAMTVPRFDTDGVQAELCRRRRREQRRRKALATGGAAAAVFLLCGVGTVTAKNYVKSTIEIGGSGFTMTASESEETPEPFFEVGGGLSGEGTAPGGEQYYAETTVMEETLYADIEAFLEQADAADKVPDLSFLEEQFPDTEVGVIDDGGSVSLRLWTEEKFFFLMQLDHRDTEGYSSATSYTGESVNERNYINSQGLNYVIFDTMGEEGKIESTHAVISVNGRDLTLDFRGFGEEEIKEILNRMDLAFYFCD